MNVDQWLHYQRIAVVIGLVIAAIVVFWPRKGPKK